MYFFFKLPVDFSDYFRFPVKCRRKVFARVHVFNKCFLNLYTYYIYVYFFVLLILPSRLIVAIFNARLMYTIDREKGVVSASAHIMYIKPVIYHTFLFF